MSYYVMNLCICFKLSILDPKKLTQLRVALKMASSTYIIYMHLNKINLW